MHLPVISTLLLPNVRVHFLVLGWLESLQKSFPRDGPSLCARQAETAGTGMAAYFVGGMAREVTNNGQ